MVYLAPELTSALAWELATGGPWPDPDALQSDEHFMALALREAQKGVGLSSPNPPVGCVLVKDGRVIGRGVHTRAGDPHGEIMALRDAEQRGHDSCGATAYVTLEPCCHHGRTPPCTDALIQAGVVRVVIGVRDPNPRVDGGGLAILKAHGIAVEEGVLQNACARFHAPFLKLIRTGLPWVTLKLALDVEGAMGADGQSIQITPPAIQQLAHALRRASDAILVGRRTVEIDDPELTDRWPEPSLAHRHFFRVVLDSQGSLAASHRVWRIHPSQPALRVVTSDVPVLKGVQDLQLPPEASQRCSLRHLLHELAALGLGRVLIEGGATLAQAALDGAWVDEFHLFQSDQRVGGTPLKLDLSKLNPFQIVASWPTGTWKVARAKSTLA
jgi:diaminohydroxyphosphoribosylaminopyrimidine deaminase / 5-amino-6-(5-phosphoribosylamino)uracil reductase